MNPPLPAHLPEPPDALQSASKRLQREIVATIETDDGWLSFEKFMYMALYQPDLGYYVAGQQTFGEQGDFITAPILGNLFARSLANQCAELLPHLPENTIMEFGAGDGSLALDLLCALDDLDCLPDQYSIVDVGEELKHRQQQKLRESAPALFPRISWLTQLPDHYSGMVIANEVMDAMPVRRFRMVHGVAYEIGVGAAHDELALVLADRPMVESIQNRLSVYDLPQGYESEINLQAEAWISSVCEIMDSGVVLLLDYGFPAAEYYHPDRNTGTLMCHYQHYAHGDALFHPGLQDITAHVDFTAIAQSAADQGFAISGYASQGGFLLGCGALEILADAQRTPSMSEKDRIELNQQIKKLTMPHEMGELFKVLALSKGLAIPMRGFALQNRAGRL